ncbi:MAG: hypothetical protein JST58_20070 [Bacteroidetes bacterium]|nr:hypothetical protein [Bacteroidota bacterium]
MGTKKIHNTDKSSVREDASPYGFVHRSDIDKLKEDIYRSDKEKLHLFVKMLRRNALLNKAVITNQPAP